GRFVYWYRQPQDEWPTRVRRCAGRGCRFCYRCCRGRWRISDYPRYDPVFSDVYPACCGHLVSDYRSKRYIWCLRGHRKIGRYRLASDLVIYLFYDCRHADRLLSIEPDTRRRIKEDVWIFNIKRWALRSF